MWHDGSSNSDSMTEFLAPSILVISSPRRRMDWHGICPIQFRVRRHSDHDSHRHHHPHHQHYPSCSHNRDHFHPPTSRVPNDSTSWYGDHHHCCCLRPPTALLLLIHNTNRWTVTIVREKRHWGMDYYYCDYNYGSCGYRSGMTGRTASVIGSMIRPTRWTVPHPHSLR